MWNGFILVALLAALPQHTEIPCSVPILVATDAGFEVAVETIGEGETQVLDRTGVDQRRVVEVLLPVSVGMSGSLIRGDEDRALVLRCGPDQLQVLVREPGGDRPIPSIDRSNYHRYELRLNVTPQQGAPVAFLVRHAQARPDDGPVIDMFRGQIPMGPGDVALTLEVKERPTESPTLVGAIPLERLGPYVGTRVSLPGGTAGRFVVDLGATRSVVAADLLASETPLRDLVAIEQSIEGTRELPAAAQAAGGAADSVARVAELEWLEVGDLRLEDLTPLVMDSPPTVDGQRIDGILGLDILRRAGRIRGSFAASDAPARLELGAPPLEETVELPLIEVRGLLFVAAKVAERPLLLLLDSGARLSVVPPAFARDAQLELTSEPIDELRGLDGAALPVYGAPDQALRVANWELPSASLVVGDLPVLAALGLEPTTGLLGQPFWAAVGAVEVDFEAGVLRIRAH